MPITINAKKNMPYNIIEIILYFIAEFNINCVHIVAYSGVFVNDLQLFYRKIINMHQKRHNETDRFYKTNNDQSKNYAVF